MEVLSGLPSQVLSTNEINCIDQQLNNAMLNIQKLPTSIVSMLLALCQQLLYSTSSRSLSLPWYVSLQEIPFSCVSTKYSLPVHLLASHGSCKCGTSYFFTSYPIHCNFSPTLPKKKLWKDWERLKLLITGKLSWDWRLHSCHHCHIFTHIFFHLAPLTDFGLVLVKARI